MIRKSIVSYLSVICAMIFWSLSFVWFKMVNEFYHPVTIVFLRLLISSILLFLLSFAFGWLQKIHKKDFKLLIGLALLNPFLYFIGESFGLTYVSSTIGAVIISLIPVFTPFAAYYFFREKLTYMNYAGILISFIGVVVIVMKRNVGLTFPVQGLFLLLLAVFSAVIYTIVLKKMSSRYNAITLISYQNLLGTFFFLPLFLSLDLSHFLSVKMDLKAIVPLLELSVFASSLAFILFTFSVRELGATRSNVFSNVIPALTAIASYLLLNEEFTVQKILGIMVVISGLFLSQARVRFLKGLLNSRWKL